MAHSHNSWPLSTGNGASVRLRVDRQPRYKQARYLMEILVVNSRAPFDSGKGGYWPDRGYEWYAGI